MDPDACRPGAAAGTVLPAPQDQATNVAAGAGDAERRHVALLATLRNIPALADEADVETLAGRFSGVPALLLDGGVSLEHAIGALGDARDRALLVATGAALGRLLDAGVAPHVVVTSDEHHEPLEQPADGFGTYLVANATSSPAALDGYRDRIFFFRTTGDHPWPWLQSIGLGRGLLESDGSAVSTAVSLVLALGCDRVVLAGVDFTLAADGDATAQPGDNTAEEERAADASAAGSPVVIVRDLAGRAAVSTRALVACRDHLLEQFAAAPRRRFINATQAGILAGPGVRQSSLAEVLPALPRLRPDALARLLADAHACKADGRTRVAEALGTLVDRPDGDGQIQAARTRIGDLPLERLREAWQDLRDRHLGGHQQAGPRLGVVHLFPGTARHLSPGR